jgi:uncharacterized protein YggU (UPF0235/DUF167 family)
VDTENKRIIEAKVITNAGKDKIEYTDGRLKIWVSEPPQNNKANKKALSLLRMECGKCEILLGAKSKKKLIRVEKSPKVESKGF